MQRGLCENEGVVRATWRRSTEDDKGIDWYSNSKLVAMDTCAKWGIVRFGLARAFSTNSRAMALEAGGAAHQAFAAVRLYCLGKQGHVDHMRFHATRLFDRGRDEEILKHYDAYPDESTCVLNMALTALNTSGFYDDPRDKRRTMTNIEESVLAYTNRYPVGKYPIWVSNPNDPTSEVGIELFFDLVVSVDDTTARYIGTIDGLHTTYDNDAVVRLLLEENKTASRLDEAWRQSFETSHQVTGYAIAARAITGSDCDRGIVRGIQIPLPRSYDLGGLVTEPVKRHQFQFDEWFKWFKHGVERYRLFMQDPMSAPMMTHSCNRYFRPCSLIPLCASDYEEQKIMLEEMEEAPMSPSEAEMHSKSGD